MLFFAIFPPGLAVGWEVSVFSLYPVIRPSCGSPPRRSSRSKVMYGKVSPLDQRETLIAPGVVSPSATHLSSSFPQNSSFLIPLFPRFRSFITSPSEQSRGQTTLPELNWADRQQMWDLMAKKETGMYRRQEKEALLAKHPALQPRMRAILLDWLIEVRNCSYSLFYSHTFSSEFPPNPCSPRFAKCTGFTARRSTLP